MISTAITTVSDLLGTTDGASVDELTPGMHVVAHRIGYQHHGIYIGDGQVVAYLLDTGVTVCSWSTFADGDKVTVYEHDDALYSADEIVDRALDRVGEDDYNLVFNNCELFANWCITGQAKSYQVREVAIETTALAAVAALALHHAQTAVRVGSVAFSAVRALTAASAVGGGVAASAGAGATATATTAGAVSGAAAATGLAAVAVPVAAAAATVAVGVGLYKVLSDDEVRDSISEAFDSVSSVASESYDIISDTASEIGDEFSALASDIADSVSETASDVIDSVGDTACDVLDSVGDLASSAVDTVGDIASGAADLASDAVDTVGDLASDAYDTVSDLASDACDAVSDFADSVGDFFSGIFK